MTFHIYIYIYILFFRQCCARYHNVVTLSHAVRIVCILYRSGLNICVFVAVSLVYNSQTGPVITSFIDSFFQIFIIIIIIIIIIVIIIIIIIKYHFYAVYLELHTWKTRSF